MSIYEAMITKFSFEHIRYSSKKITLKELVFMLLVFVDFSFHAFSSVLVGPIGPTTGNFSENSLFCFRPNINN